jgi:prepilin-type processing-associated H-X9-DG protein
LWVVMGLIALVILMFLPAICPPRRQARLLQCANNVRQLGLGIHMYATENRGKYPLNVYFPSPGRFWYDADRVGALLAPNGVKKGGVFSCPDDSDGLRSYAMNVWVSSQVDDWVLNQTPATGCLWGSAPSNSSRVILLIESWSYTGADSFGYSAAATAGYLGATPGQRFGGAGGLPPISFGRWGLVNSEVAFARHRSPNGPGRLNEPVGAVNVAYVDGHVELRRSSDLYDEGTGRSTLDSLWSPLDLDQNR